MDQSPAAAAHQREQALFAAALERPAPERAAFLDGVCHGDPALRARLEALLAAHERPATALDKPTELARPTVKHAPIVETPDESVGQTLGRYKLLERVGEGGCGVVYVAEQTEPVRRRVALKVIKLGMDTKQVVARFEAERQALAMMDHPNIAKVLDAGTTDVGRPYFVMELVRGIRITDYCDQANLSTKERLDLFIKVCQAIQHAHQKGIIHRDIKPSNILVTLHDGVPVPKVIDFGIAKATEGRLTDATVYTQLHQFIGTPAYMSPEQAEMSGLDIDTRSDIYSLGVLLYELLAGSTPFDPKELMASGLDAMRKTIREKEPQRPSTRLATLGADQLTTTARRRSADTSKLLHQLKGDLDWIVMKCLEKDRQRRYDTANGLATDLRRHLNNEPVVARPPSATYKFQKAFRRNKLLFTAGATVAVALVLGIGFSTWQAVEAKRARITAVQAQTAALSAQKVAETERERAEQEAASRRVQLYAAEVNLAGETLAEDDLNRARELLAKQNPAPGETNDLRGFEWRYLWHQAQSAELTTLGQHDDAVHGVRFSPDGTLLASSGVNGTVKLWDYRNRKHIILRDPTVQPTGGNAWAVKPLAFSPDGGRLAVGVGRDIVLWEVASHRRLAVLSGHTERVNYLVFARGGKIMASGADDLQVRVWDVTSAEPREIAALPAGFTVSSLAFSPDGKTLAASGSSPSIKRWGLSNPDAPVELPPLKTKDAHTAWVMALAFSPNTNLLVSAGSDGRVIGWHLGNDPKEFLPYKLPRPYGSIGIVNAVAFTPDGQTILSAGSDNNITLWDVSGKEPPIRLMGHVREVFSIDVSPDGRTLASGGDDRMVRLWDISSRWREKPKMSHGAYIHTVAISPNSKFVASVAHSSKLTLWDAATEKPLAEQPTPSISDGHLAFSPDSKILAADDTETGTIRLLKVPSFEEITSFRGSCPLFSPDGTELVYFRGDIRIGIHWRDLKTQDERLWKTEWNRVRCLAISPDGRSIAAANGRSVWTWNANAPDHPVEMGTLAEDEELSNQDVWDVAFSPDGHWLASACWDGNVSLWNLDNPHEKIRPFKALNGAAWAVAFSPDGRTLATAGDDATIKLWNLASRQQTATLRGHTGPVNALAFSRDGTLLASCSGDGTVHLWRAPPLEAIEKAEAK